MLILVPGTSGLSYQFDLTDVFFPGQARILSKAEARALNQARADNVRKNLTRKLKKAETEAPDGVLTLGQIGDLQGALTQYAQGYELPEGQESDRLGSIEQEAREIVEAKGKGDPADRAIRELARQRIISRRRMLQAALPHDL